MLLDLEIYLTNDGEITFLQQVIIWKNASSDRIFDRHHAAVAFLRVASDLHYFPESGTRYHFNLFPKKITRSSLVKAALVTLDGNLNGRLCFYIWRLNLLFHAVLVINKNPGFSAGILYVNRSFQFLTQAFPATFKVEIKIKERESFCDVHDRPKIYYMI